jgi:hypothetical protein
MVNATAKNHQVYTVSGGGWMERYSPSRRRRLSECTVSGSLCEESKERSTRPTSTIQCVPCQAAAGWRGIAHLGGEDLQECIVLDGLCEESKERSTRPTSTIQWGPCQAAAGWSPSRRRRILTARSVLDGRCMERKE